MRIKYSSFAQRYKNIGKGVVRSRVVVDNPAPAALAAARHSGRAELRRAQGGTDDLAEAGDHRQHRPGGDRTFQQNKGIRSLRGGLPARYAALRRAGRGVRHLVENGRRRPDAESRRDRRRQTLPARNPVGRDEHQTGRQPAVEKEEKEKKFRPDDPFGPSRRPGSLHRPAAGARPALRHRFLPHAPLRAEGAGRRLHHRRYNHPHDGGRPHGTRTQRFRAGQPRGPVLPRQRRPRIPGRAHRNRPVGHPHPLHLAGRRFVGRLQGFHPPGPDRRRHRPLDDLDRRHRLFHPEPARLAPHLQRRGIPGRRDGGRLRGTVRQPARRRPHRSGSRLRDPRTARHRRDAFRSDGRTARLVGRRHRRAGPRHRPQEAPVGFVDGARPRGNDAAERTVQRPAEVVRNPRTAALGGGRRHLHAAASAAEQGVEPSAGRGPHDGVRTRETAGTQPAAGTHDFRRAARRHDGPRHDRRQCGGTHLAARIQRLRLRLAPLRRQNPQQGVRRTDHRARPQPRLRLLRIGRPERHDAILRFPDGAAARRSGPAARQPARLRIDPFGKNQGQSERPVAGRPERPNPDLRRPLSIQRPADRGTGYDRDRRELADQQVRRAAVGLRRRPVPQQNQLPRGVRIPQAERLEVPAAAPRPPRPRRTQRRGTDLAGRRIFAHLGQHQEHQPDSRRRSGRFTDRRRFVAATDVQPRGRQAVDAGVVGVYRTQADAHHAAERQRRQPRRFAGRLRLGRGPLCGHVPPAAPLGHGRRPGGTTAAVGGIHGHAAQKLGAARHPGLHRIRRRPGRPHDRSAHPPVAHHPRRHDLADLRRPHPDRYDADRHRQLPCDEPRAAPLDRRHRLAQPRRLPHAASAQLRPGLLLAGRQPHRLRHPRLYERYGHDQVGPPGQRDLGRHPDGQRADQPDPGAAPATRIALGLQPQPGGRHPDRPHDRNDAHPRLLRPGARALLRRDPHRQPRHGADRPGALGRRLRHERARRRAADPAGRTPQRRTHGQYRRDRTFDHRRLHGGDLLDAARRAGGARQPVPGEKRPDFRPAGQPGPIRLRPQPATPLEHRLRRAGRSAADAGARYDRAGQRTLLRPRLRHGPGVHHGRQGGREARHHGLDRRRLLVHSAALGQVEYLERRLRHLRPAFGYRHDELSGAQEADVRTAAPAQKRFGRRHADRHGTRHPAEPRLPAGHRPGIGQRDQGPRRGLAQPRHQPQNERIRDVRRLHHRRRKLPVLAAEPHQQEIHHRERIDDPMDGRPGERAAEHQRRLQAQGVAATAAAGHGRQCRRRPVGAGRVRHPSGRPAGQSVRVVRRAGSGRRSRDADCSGQRAQHA